VVRDRSRLLRCLAAALGLAALVGCGSNDSTIDERSAAEVLAEKGWDEFAAGNYVGAGELFEDALASDSLYADAENGLGWVNLFFGLFATADEHFVRAIALGLPSQEAEAGHAIDSELDGDFDEALAASGRVLAAQPQFSFSRRAGIDFRDLRLLRARSYVAKGLFLDAKAEVDIVNPSNNVNPGLPTFVPDLLAEIERLGEEIYDL
jgi:tetratricopeptide (TPR) repeat protein